MNTPRPGPPGRFSADPAEAVMLTDILFAQAERLGDKPFLHGRVGGRVGGRIGGRAGDIGKDENGDGGWATLTWSQAADQVRRLAGGLTRIGIKPGDRVVLVSENSPQWLIADHAIMAAGAITVPGYTTNTEDDHLHLLTDSGAAAAIVATNALGLRLMPAAERSSDCRHVIAMEPVGLGQALDFETHLWDDLLRGDPAPPHEGSRTDTACIIYTSGTGGAPKGVMLSHGAILSNCDAIKHLFRNFDLSAEVFLSFLPLSHSYEHTAGQFFPVSIGAEIYYAKGTDTLAQDMAQVRPSFMTAVPRLYELFQGRIMLGLKKASPFSRALFERTLALGRKRIEAPTTLTLWERIQDFVLDRLVRAKVQQRFGGRLRFMVSGGAPLNPEVGSFFLSLGINILQGYGQTESAPVVSCNLPEKIKIDTVGPPLDKVQCRIAEDGEILVKGELVMQGYWRKPEATNETIRDGWLHTGDIGAFDADGYLRITDRKKDIIVNSGGDNISPQRVEGFLTLEPEINQAMVFGDKRPHLVAVIVPEDDGNSADKPALEAMIMGAIERVNKALSPIERVRRIIIADAPFTTDNGQMTPTLKVRRHVIIGIYGERLEDLYRR